MSLPIEDYALIGDCHTAALVARNGSIDWLCLPRFDSASCLAALLGDENHGRWKIEPDDGARYEVARRYDDHTLILETVFTTDGGSVAVIDFMPPRQDHRVSHVVRIVEGRGGRVKMRSAISLRFNYGATMPWVVKLPDGTEGVRAIAGPDMIVIRSSVPQRGEDMHTVAHFDAVEGERTTFVLTYTESHLDLPKPLDAARALEETRAFWQEWNSRCQEEGKYADEVVRSLMVLKALTYEPTGGIVAAATTSLPEAIGGVRNWDYRYCWLRDATLTLFALMNAGYYDEARAWRMWLERAVAGDPSRLQIMYGAAGESRLEEWTVDTLPGYEDSRPVRIGNAAVKQLQLDVFGELGSALHYARVGGIEEDDAIWPFQLAMLAYLETIWREPDQGLWEMRQEPRHFTFSKVMVWVAFDRAIRSAEQFGLDGPVDDWRALCDTIRAEVLEKGFDRGRNTFVQSYGSQSLDASLLLIPLTGFLAFDDPRIVGTVAAIEHDLLVDGYVMRYGTHEGVDGLPPGEGVFLACSFWLVENLRQQGRVDEATTLFERLLGVANDVGLLAEEYDPVAKRQLGNFPQAFSHVSLVNAALGLMRPGTRIGDKVLAGQPVDAPAKPSAKKPAKKST